MVVRKNEKNTGLYGGRGETEKELRLEGDVFVEMLPPPPPS